MINLFLCGNDRMFDGFLISTLSIAKHTDEALNVILLTMNRTEQDARFVAINDEQAAVIEKALQKYNKDSKVKVINCDELFKEQFEKGKNLTTHYTPYIFLRLLVDLIPEMPDKALYLDTDIVAYQDIKEFYNMDIGDYELTASLDYLGRNAINPKYINSGVLIMNIKKIKETGSFIKAREMCKTKKMMLPDQTAIYKCCTILRVPDKYNEQKRRRKDTVLRHFSMQLHPFFPCNIKPWHIEKLHDIYKIYDLDDVLEEYRNIKYEAQDNGIIKF